MSEMVVELREQATGIRYGWHDRYKIPLNHRAALRFYLNNLFVPHSRREMLWALVARASSLAGRVAVPLFRVGGTDLSGKKSVGETSESEMTSAQGSVEPDIEFLTGRLEKHLRSAGVTINGSLAFLSLDDYRHTSRQKMVLFIFDEAGRQPCAVAKIGGAERHGTVLAHEHETMNALHGRVSEELGRTMPQPLALFEERGLIILLESFVGGRSIYFEMRNSWRPRTLAARHFRLAREWVVGFQQAAQRREASLDEEAVSRYVNRPLQDFKRLCAPAPRELELIREVSESARQLQGERLPLVARQGDFWARNLILQGDAVRVVDWEGFSEQSTPFSDLFLFTTSYALSYPWRLGRWAEPSVAFRAAYLEPSWFAQLVRRNLFAYCREMDMSPKLLEIFFPVFLAERALAEKKQLDEGREKASREARRLRPRGEREAADEVRTVEVGTWRRLFQEYAERTGRACFG